MLYKLTLQAAFDAMPLYDTLCENKAVSTSWFETAPFSDCWQFEALFDEKPDMVIYERQAMAQGLPWQNVHLEPLADRNWLEENRKSFQPIEVGCFFIHDSCYEGSYPQDCQKLVIDAATAFGTGHHATTRLCLQLILDLDKTSAKPQTVLDLGCGTGILGMAAYRLWQSRVFLSDNDPEAVERTRMNLDKNNCQGIPLLAEGFDHAVLEEQPPFDLIVANILAGPLIELAPRMYHHLASQGHCILSGILTDQALDVIAVYKSQGFKLKTHYQEDMWSALGFDRPSS